MRVHLVRHGEVENPDNVRYGRLPHFGLSVRGRREARAAALALAGRLDAIVTSPLERAVESATLLAGQNQPVVPEVDERLTEAHEWREGLPRGLAPAQTIARLARLARLPPVERPWTIAARMSEAVLDLLQHTERPDAEVAMVTHQTPIRFVRLYFERTSQNASLPRTVRLLPRVYSRYRCRTGSITTLVFEGQRFTRSEYREP